MYVREKVFRAPQVHGRGCDFRGSFDRFNGTLLTQSDLTVSTVSTTPYYPRSGSPENFVDDQCVNNLLDPAVGNTVGRWAGLTDIPTWFLVDASIRSPLYVGVGDRIRPENARKSG